MKKVSILIGLFLILVTLTACGSKNSKSSMNTGSQPKSTVTTEVADTARDVQDGVQSNATGATPGLPQAQSGNESQAVNQGSVLQPGEDRKLIKQLFLAMETKEFDDAVKKINSAVTTSGGYLESSSVSGNSYYQEDGKRSAYMICRIPVDKYEGFVQGISSIANVTSNQESTQDITLQYVDTQSRITALKVEQDRLLELMNKAEKMEDIIAIESKLSEIRYELQNYESTLKAYENQVSYSTVTINLLEVERVTDKNPKGFWQEIGSKFKTSCYNIGNGLKNLVIWFFGSSPYLVFVGVLAFAGIVAIRIFRKKRRKIVTKGIAEEENRDKTGK